MAAGLGLIWISAGILRTLAITWPQDVTCEEDSLAEAAQVNGNVGRPDRAFSGAGRDLVDLRPVEKMSRPGSAMTRFLWSPIKGPRRRYTDRGRKPGSLSEEALDRVSEPLAFC
jgi:hypothetical protein